MIDLGLIAVAVALLALVGSQLVRVVRARSVRRDVDEYLTWVESDTRSASR